MRAALVLVPLVLVASCGGGDSGLSKKDYVTKAEAICDKANKDVEALTTPTSTEAIVAYVQQIVGIADKATKDLAALEEPKGDKADLKKKMLDPLASQVQEGKDFQQQVAAALAARDQAKLAKLIQDPPVTTKADLTWMRSYGFKACVKAADESGK